MHMNSCSLDVTHFLSSKDSATPISIYNEGWKFGQECLLDPKVHGTDEDIDIAVFDVTRFHA